VVVKEVNGTGTKVGDALPQPEVTLESRDAHLVSGKICRRPEHETPALLEKTPRSRARAFHRPDLLPLATTLSTIEARDHTSELRLPRLVIAPRHPRNTAPLHHRSPQLWKASRGRSIPPKNSSYSNYPNPTTHTPSEVRPAHARPSGSVNGGRS
jgi:hypothetical protein